jgi:hypothetical protein
MTGIFVPGASATISSSNLSFKVPTPFQLSEENKDNIPAASGHEQSWIRNTRRPSSSTFENHGNQISSASLIDDHRAGLALAAGSAPLLRIVDDFYEAENVSTAEITSPTRIAQRLKLTIAAIRSIFECVLQIAQTALAEFARMTSHIRSEAAIGFGKRGFAELPPQPGFETCQRIRSDGDALPASLPGTKPSRYSGIQPRLKPSRLKISEILCLPRRSLGRKVELRSRRPRAGLDQATILSNEDPRL